MTEPKSPVVVSPVLSDSGVSALGISAGSNTITIDDINDLRSFIKTIAYVGTLIAQAPKPKRVRKSRTKAAA